MERNDGFTTSTRYLLYIQKCQTITSPKIVGINWRNACCVTRRFPPPGCCAAQTPLPHIPSSKHSSNSSQIWAHLGFFVRLHVDCHVFLLQSRSHFLCIRVWKLALFMDGNASESFQEVQNDGSLLSSILLCPEEVAYSTI